MSQDISKDPKQELQAKIAAANRRGEFLLIVLGAAFLITILAWVLFHYEIKTACYFRDNPFLRDLWPPNATALSQMQSLPYSERDQCTFFGVRSIASLTLLLGFTTLIAFTFKALRGFRVKKIPLIFPVLLIGFGILFMWLDKFDNYHGPHTWLGFHPSDSINAAIIKSLLRIYLYYWLLFVWVISLIAYFFWKRVPAIS
ncbi:hypothetical protein [Rhizobium sp. A37_96]